MISISFSIENVIVPCSYCAPFVPPNLLHPTKSNLYLANSLATAVSEPALYRLLTFHVPKTMSLFLLRDIYIIKIDLFDGDSID